MRLRWFHGIVSMIAVTGLGAAAAAAGAVDAAAAPDVVMYKGASCACCLGWAGHLTDAGFAVEPRVPDDLTAVFTEHAVPMDLRSCHLAIVEGYLVVGHVPVGDIRRLLRERPAIAGIAVPAMPAGAPGMDNPGADPSPYDVLAFDAAGRTSVYARH